MLVTRTFKVVDQIPQYFDFNFVYKFLSNKKFLLVASGKAERPRILSCQIFHLS